MFGRLCRVRFPKLALAASCVSMRSPTEELWRLLQKGPLISRCQESMAHQLLLEEIERSLFPCPYIPTIPQRDSLQAASWNALCAPIRQHYLILHTATSKLINNQTYHGLRFWKLIPHSILPILHPLRQNHRLIKMQIASENLHVQSWRRILANLRKWPHKRNETVARVQQHHSPNNTWHQAIRRNFWHHSMVMLPAPLSCWQTVSNVEQRWNGLQMTCSNASLSLCSKNRHNSSKLFSFRWWLRGRILRLPELGCQWGHRFLRLQLCYSGSPRTCAVWQYAVHILSVNWLKETSLYHWNKRKNNQHFCSGLCIFNPSK